MSDYIKYYFCHWVYISVVKKVKMGMSLAEYLKTIGFTMYEIKAYTALVKNRELNARELSRISEVPYSKTYEITSLLEKKGLIEIQRGRPMVFRATSPQNALNVWTKGYLDEIDSSFTHKIETLEMERDKTLSSINDSLNKASSLLQRFFDDSEGFTANDELIWTIRGEANIVSQVVEIVQKSRSIRMIMHDKLASILGSKFGEVRTKGDIIIQRIDPKNVTLPRYMSIYLIEDIAFECSFVISDSGETIFTTQELDIAFKSSNPELSTILTHFFEHEKEEAKAYNLLDIN
jgi:sugar-specific transcriptional regulator TrmB